MRRFFLQRHEDISGVSGVGTVAEGVEFSDGTVALRWLTARRSTVVWNSIEDAIAIHGYGGLTEVVWIDPEAPSKNRAPLSMSRTDNQGGPNG